MSLPMPKKVPEIGFYYHYKHDPSNGLQDHAYELWVLVFIPKMILGQAKNIFLFIDLCMIKTFTRLQKNLELLALMLVRWKCGWKMLKKTERRFRDFRRLPILL